MGARSGGDDEAGTRIILKNFPLGWCTDGKDLLQVSLQGQLQVFGPLKGLPWVAPSLKEAEVVFENAKDAEEAIEVLHGVDFREPEELAKNPGVKYDGLFVALKPSTKRAAPPVQSEPPSKAPRLNSGGLGDAPGLGAIDTNLAEFVGTWWIGYMGSSADMSYTITETGEVRVGKKRWLQLVPAGSFKDEKQDSNYTGTYLLDNAHREDTWEYLWLEDGQLKIHHFTADDTGTSPYGSPHYWGSGHGLRADQVQSQGDTWQSKQQPPTQMWTAKPQGWLNQAVGPMAAFEGIWTVMYEGDQELDSGMSYNISGSGDVTVGKKRHLQLVPAGSPQDTKQDPNYMYEGIFLLDNCHREDTWEYIWMENGRIFLHHFSLFDSKISPFGSPHFWGRGVAISAAPEASRGLPHAPSWNGPVQKHSYWRPMMGGSSKVTTAWPVGQKATTTSWGGDIQPLQPEFKKVEIRPNELAVAPKHLVEEFEGSWTIEYEPGGGGAMTYIIDAGGEVKIGKKRRCQLVPAGSEYDLKQDFNYAGAYFLNNPHREDTWEYVWIEDGQIHLHHFTGDDTKLSPHGSPNYYGAAVGVKR